MKERITIMFDNGGGATLVTENFAHHYDDMHQLKTDYNAIAAGEDTQGWDGNDSEAREWFDSVEENWVENTQNGSVIFYENEEIKDLLKKDPEFTWGANVRIFILA